MKKSLKLLAILLVMCLALSFVAACGDDKQPCTSHVDANSDGVCDNCGAPVEKDNGDDNGQQQFVDYAASLKLDMSSDSKKASATVKNYVDGDTTHFYVDKSVSSSGILKARYLAINTPESTGKIEDYGHTASRFTKAKLQSAVSIILESDDGNWNLDSTGSRHLVWVWYKTSADGEYRNLNLEILQEGLARASNTANNRYGETCMKALRQAETLKKYVYSGVADPEVYRGEAIELTLKELRTNIESYNGKKVAFEGTSILLYNHGVYLEDYDFETDMYYGIYVYYGFNFNGVSIIKPGCRVRMVGTVQYYETGDSYQISDVTYDAYDKTNPNTVQLVSRNNTVEYRQLDPDEFINGKVNIEKETIDAETGEERTEVVPMDYAELALSTSASLNGLKIKSIYTTDNEDSSNDGAMTFTCEIDGKTVSVRTVPLYDENDQLLTEADFRGKTINVKGIVDCFNGKYQIKVFRTSDIEVVD